MFCFSSYRDRQSSPGARLNVYPGIPFLDTSLSSCFGIMVSVTVINPSAMQTVPPCFTVKEIIVRPGSSAALNVVISPDSFSRDPSPSFISQRKVKPSSTSLRRWSRGIARKFFYFPTETIADAGEILALKRGPAKKVTACLHSSARCC